MIRTSWLEQFQKKLYTSDIFLSFEILKYKSSLFHTKLFCWNDNFAFQKFFASKSFLFIFEEKAKENYRVSLRSFLWKKVFKSTL